MARPMKTPPLRFLVLAGSVTLAAAQTPNPPSPAAQPPDESVKLEAFTVTGSNIRRIDAEAALPVSVFDKEDIGLRNGSTMADLFETITMAEPSGLNESNTGPQGARGDVNSIDLRGLGSGSTLTLLNGRRFAPHPISMAENGVPSLAANANAIPTALIGRVEILRDGASAIYGADAAAGVINNITSTSYNGRSLAAKMSMTQHGGANEYRFTATDGFKSGKTHISTAVDYFHRDALSASDRFWASQMDLRLARELPAPWNGVPVTDPVTGVVQARDNDFANTNAVNQYGQWVRGAIQPDYLTFVGSRPTGNTGISTSTTPPVGTATMSTAGVFFFWPDPAGNALNWKQTAPSKNIDSPENATYSNWAKWRILVPRTDRFNFSTFVDRPLTERISFFGDFMFYKSRSFSGREPINFDNVDEPGIYVPASNPYNPFGVRFYSPTGAPNADGTPRLVGTPADVSMVGGVTPVELKPRIIKVDSHLFRALAGLRGKVGDNWQWESAVLYSGAQTHEFEHNYMRESLLRRALNRTDSTALNPFGYTFKIVNNLIVSDKPFINPASVWDPLYADDERYGRTKLFVWDAKTNGELWRLFNGGKIGVASGAELRWESYDDKRPLYSGMNPPGAGKEFPYLRDGDNDILALSPNVSIAAAQTVYAFYSEVALPFVTQANRKPLVDALELTLAGRFEHFSIHGQTTKPKVSLVWKPTSWLKLRGSFNESFRAPNLVQTSVTSLQRSVAATDAYRSEVTALATDGNVNRLVFRQGNQDLKPETAQSWVTGFVIEVPKIKGLSLTFDYWRLNQNNVIDNIGAPGTLSRDELYLDLATQKALASGTPADQIDLGSGTDNYQGYKTVKRKPVSAADRAAYAAFNAKQTSNATRRAPVGEFVSLIDNYVNLGGRDLEGYELGFQYRFPKNPLGQFILKGESTHYVRREDKAEEDGPVLNELGKNGRADWRANVSLSWRRGAWGAGWFTSYYGSFVDTSAATTEVIYNALGRPRYISQYYDNGVVRYVLRVEPVVMHNAYLSYRFTGKTQSWLRGVSLRGGITNIFDVEPSISDETQGTGYLGGVANVRGRQFSLDVTKSF